MITYSHSWNNSVKSIEYIWKLNSDATQTLSDKHSTEHSTLSTDALTQPLQLHYEHSITLYTTPPARQRSWTIEHSLSLKIHVATYPMPLHLPAAGDGYVMAAHRASSLPRAKCLLAVSRLHHARSSGLGPLLRGLNINSARVYT